MIFPPAQQAAPQAQQAVQGVQQAPQAAQPMATPVAGQQAVPMVPQMGQLPSTATAAIPVSGLGLAALGGALYLLRRRR